MQRLCISLDFTVVGVKSPKLMHDEYGDFRLGFLCLKECPGDSSKQLKRQLQNLCSDLLFQLPSGGILIITSEQANAEKATTKPVHPTIQLGVLALTALLVR